MRNQSQLRWHHFLSSWFLCLLTGLILGVFISVLFIGSSGTDLIAISALVNGIALAVSSPFIFLFCIIIHFAVLKKPRSRSSLHAIVFLMHLLGSLLVFIGLLVFANSEVQSSSGELILLMTGYFIIDSIYFHIFIQTKANKHVKSESDSDQLLDVEF